MSVGSDDQSIHVSVQCDSIYSVCNIDSGDIHVFWTWICYGLWSIDKYLPRHLDPVPTIHCPRHTSRHW